MSQKPTSEADIIAAIRKRLQEMGPSAMKSLEDLAGQKNNKTVAKKAKRELDWQPTIPFAQGLKDTINWYLANQAWVDGIRSGDYLTYYEKQYGSRLAS